MERILIVEDSSALQKALQRLFQSNGFEVNAATDGTLATERFREIHPCAVVLDLNLPARTGKELCQEFKSSAPEIPIVILSANTDTEDKVSLFEAGADDYVTKPFSPRELLARVRRAMRYAAETALLATDASLQVSEHHVLTFADVHVNFTTRDARKAGERVALTAQEFKVLHYLSLTPGRTVSREELLEELWDSEKYPTTRTVDNHLLRLRQKLEQVPANPRHFVTVHGIGYRFLREPENPGLNP